MCMERAVSGQEAARSRIVGPDSGGGGSRPHRRDGLTSHHGPTNGRQPFAEYPPVVSSLDETRGTIDRFSLGCNDFSAMNQEKLSDVRCPRCNKLLGRGKVEIMQFKCPRCGTFYTVRAVCPNTEPPAGRKESCYGPDNVQGTPAHAGG